MLWGFIQRSMLMKTKNKKRLTPRQIKYWINRLDRACQDMAFLGATHPSEHPYIRDEYNHVKKKLFELMKGFA